MPELSPRDREKLLMLEPQFAAARLVDAFERKWEIHFQCLACGATKTWRRDTMIGRARPLLGLTMADIQRRTPCARCRARPPAMRMSGVFDPGSLAEQFKWEAIGALRDAGVDPTALGYGWRPPTPR